MKRLWTLALALLMTGLLAACGGKNTTETANADLAEFYAGLEESYEWGGGYMAEIEGELLESYYPGLGEFQLKQLVARMPQMSSVVNEMVFLQCGTEEEAAKAVAILQNRIDTQAQGGAWYPESMEAWGRGVVIQQGTYVAMIASAEHQDEIVESFNQLFV